MLLCWNRYDSFQNEYYFTSLAEAREIISNWRKDYNDVRPHSTLGKLTPAEFAARFREKGQNLEIQIDFETKDCTN